MIRLITRMLLHLQHKTLRGPRGGIIMLRHDINHPYSKLKAKKN